MSYKLYINDLYIDLQGASEIALTKQVNDIASLKDRQSNFSKQLKIPKTANNIRNFEYLGLVGSTTNIPYRQNTAKLLNADSGEFVIYNGWAVLQSTEEDFYVIAIYDGIIDFYKAIANQPMSSLDLTEVNHFRTLTTISDSITTTLPYKYIIADFNGAATIPGVATINADYLIPSINVEWLWNKIFETFGFTFTGEIFDSVAFKDLWLTYPKGTTVGLDVTTPLLDVTSSHNIGYLPGPLVRLDIDSFLLTAGTVLTDSLGYEYYVCNQEGQIRVQHTQAITATYVNTIPGGALDIEDRNTKLGVENRSTNTIYDIALGQELYIPVNPGDEIYFYAIVAFESYYGGWPDYVFGEAKFNLELYEGEKIDFKGAFEKLLITDFISEILWLFNLTPFKNRFSENIHFMTFEERVLTNNMDDWSNYFNRVKNEKYIFGDYAKVNKLQHKYNADNANYNDGAFTINNENLKDNTAVIQSKFYTTEFEPEFEIPGVKKLNIYKLWNKEVKEGTPTVVKYKALDNRFYFIKYTDTALDTDITLESAALGSSLTFSSLPIERNTGLTFKEVLTNSYKKLGYVLNQVKLTEIEFNLSRQQFSELDFTRKIYVEQTGSQYIVNKVLSFVPNKVTKVEALKIDVAELIIGESEGAPGAPGAPIVLEQNLELNAEVPAEYNFDITSQLYLGVALGSGDSIAQIEFQGYLGNLFAVAGGGDIFYNDGVLAYGDNLVLHSLNIDNLYDYTSTPRTFTYVYHVYIFNSITGLTTHKYTIIKNFTINYTEAWGRVLSYSPSNSAPANILMEDNFALNAPLRANEVYSHIIPRDFGWEYGPLSEFWGQNVEALELDEQAAFGAPLNLEPRKIDLSFYPAPGYVEGLQISYELYAFNTVTSTYRLIYNNCSLQVTLTYTA